MHKILRNLLLFAGVLSGVAWYGGGDFVAAPALGQQAGYSAGDYRQLAGWSLDNIAAAVPALLRSCARLLHQPDGGPLDPVAPSARFGRVGDWRAPCREAAALPPGDDAAVRRFFEANFLPVLAGGDGLFTGYYEVELRGARTRQGPYQTPVYRRPADAASYDRGVIEDGALAGRNLEIAWLADPADLLLLQTQGSGRIRLAEGGILRLGYAGNNGRPTMAVDQLLLRSGALPAAQFSQEAVHQWMVSHPVEARTVRRQNPAYVFFRELAGDGPIGAEGALLTPERSLAVDHRYVPLGMPLWLEAQDRYRPTRVQRLVIAQDTGDGIEGPVRGDFYWGSGAEAQARGADFYATGRYWLMLPRTVAAQVATR
jgi:membrane-bound lytic murein transglycosylase A